MGGPTLSWQTKTNGVTVAANYNAAVGAWSYRWDALGQLREVRQGPLVLARYRYNHKGERVTKAAEGRHTHYLYENGKLVAELDAGGGIRRQHIHLGDQPVAVIDALEAATAHEERTGLGQLAADIATIWRTWCGNGESIAYLHTNHLGSTELVTGSKGEPLWRAAYSAFGKAKATVANSKIDSVSAAFQFNLRLPGQYADRETGLYYNGRRYYDPASGRYLTPDPLGLRAGANGYAYVDGNPLKYVDPDGLILFAFDGTGNSETPPTDESISNVLKFEQAYDEEVNGKAYYVTGIGTTNKDMPVAGSVLTGKGFDERVALGFSFLDKFIATDTGTDLVNVDVVGFSRGAAEARVWINALVGKLKNGAYATGGKSRCISLRFEGLRDTVPHLGFTHGDESKYDFAIPSAVKYAVQAVALNEHRGGGSDFDLRSIMERPGQASSATRVEKGFIGGHSDIGGGFSTGDLSDVALIWMLDQAQGQGVSINKKAVEGNGWSVITNPIIHDRSTNRFSGGDVTETRNVIYGEGESVVDTNAKFDGKATANTRTDISYFSNPYRCGTISNPDVGLVDMTKYNQWLAGYGFTMPTGTIVNNSCGPTP